MMKHLFILIIALFLITSCASPQLKTWDNQYRAYQIYYNGGSIDKQLDDLSQEDQAEVLMFLNKLNEW